MRNQLIDLQSSHGITLVIGGTGKTGRRVAEISLKGNSSAW